MSAQPDRYLQPVPDEELLVVNPGTGETRPLRDHVQDLEDVIAGLRRDVNAEHLRFENLKRDKAAEAKGSAYWPKAKEVFDHWCAVCKHPNSKFDTTRFELILPHLEEHGVELCKRACDGAAHDAFCTKRRNGSTKRHDGITLIFRDADHFEDFVNRAPKPPPKPQGSFLDDDAEN